MSVDERNREHVRGIAQERGPVVLDTVGDPARQYEAAVLDFLATIRQYNLCLETTENAEAFAAKVREYLRTGPDAQARTAILKGAGAVPRFHVGSLIGWALKRERGRDVARDAWLVATDDRYVKVPTCATVADLIRVEERLASVIYAKVVRHFVSAMRSMGYLIVKRPDQDQPSSTWMAIGGQVE